MVNLLVEQRISGREEQRIGVVYNRLQLLQRGRRRTAAVAQHERVVAIERVAYHGRRQHREIVVRYVVGNGIRLFAVERSPLEVGTEREAPFVEIPSQTQSGSMRKIVGLIHARHLVNELFAQVGHAVALKRLLVGVAVAVRELIVGAQLHVVHYRLGIHQVGAQRCLLLVVVLALRIFRGRCRAFLGLAFLIVGVGVAALVGYLSVHR